MKSEKNKRPKFKKTVSINLAIWGYFCLFAFLLIFIVEIIFLTVMTQTLNDRARDRVGKIGAEVVADIKLNPLAAEEIILKYRKEGVNIYILNKGGEILLPQGTDSSITEELFLEIDERLGDLEVGVSTTCRSHYSICYAEKVDYVGENYLLVTYSLSVIRDSLGTLQFYLVLIGIIVLLLAFIVSFSLSQKLSRGLKTMSDTAVNLAKGDYSVHFNNMDFTEMAQLSDTLNYVRDEVKKSEDFQHEILANVTHDLKTPLTMIKAYASMIKEISGDNPEKREKHLQVIIDEADRLTGLVNDVLSVSKINSNLDAINAKVFNLTELLYGIIGKFGYLQETMGYSFMLDIDSNLYTRADEEKISQVIYNLLGNASNYTGEDKKVYISLKLSMDAKRIKFSVRDTGKGITKEELPEIWNRYYRVNETHSRPVKGTGLGLNIVKVILQNHSFDFGVESEVGKGSTFWVDFPAVPAEIGVPE